MKNFPLAALLVSLPQFAQSQTSHTGSLANQRMNDAPKSSSASIQMNAQVPASLCSGTIVSPRGTDPQSLPPANLPENGTVQIDVPESVATKLAAYVYNGDTNNEQNNYRVVLAPRGWHCDYFVSAGYSSTVSVHPVGDNPNYYGIYTDFRYTDGYFRGQEMTHKLAYTYFPKAMKELYAGHEDDLETKVTNPRYKSDQLSYVSDMDMDFKTPAHHTGLGSPEAWDKTGNLILVPLDVPVDGFMTMSATPDFGGAPGLCHIFSYSVIVPPGFNNLVPYLLRDEKSRPEAMPSTTSTDC